MNLQRYKVPVLVAFLGVLPLVFFEEGVTYVSRLFTIFLMFAVLALALNVAFGHTDQLLLFTGGIVGIGTYTTIAFADALGVSLWATLLLGALFAGIAGSLVCYVAARRRLNVIVISILTLALQLAMVQTFNGLREITGGNTGMRVPALEAGFVTEPLGLEPLAFLYYCFLALLALVMVVYQYVVNSKFGLAFDVIRQDEIAAESTGVAVVRYKAIAGFVTTFIMGLVGPLYVQIGGYVSPGMFTFAAIDVLVLIILVVGGMRTMYGPVVGAAVIVYVNHLLQDAQEYRTLIFGLLLIFLFLFFRNGIVPFVDRHLDDYFDYRSRLASIGSQRG